MKDHLSVQVEQTEDANLLSITFTPVVIELEVDEDYDD